MKKELLIVNPDLFVGGTTSALLSLLHSIDYDRYQIDLLLLRNEGDFLDNLPPQVNLLPPALEESNRLAADIHKFWVYLRKGFFFRKWKIKYKGDKRYPLALFQLMSGQAWAAAARQINKRYDVAIGFMEGFADCYVSTRISAARKIAWIHPDYENAGFDPELDRKMLGTFDHIVLVSPDCKAAFDRIFPAYQSRSVVLENITNPLLIRQKAEQAVDDFHPDRACVTLVTAARLQNHSKGIDRMVRVLHQLKQQGLPVKWYVFGEGSDRLAIETMINDFGLQNDFFLMGNRFKIDPYLAKADLYVMASRYEGKPIAVTEAQILGLPVITTRYASAAEQVKDGVTGLVVENNDDAICEALVRVIRCPELLASFRENLKKTDFTNHESLKQFYKLTE